MLCLLLIVFSAYRVFVFVYHLGWYTEKIGNPFFESEIKSFFSDLFFSVLSFSVSAILFIQTLLSMNAHHAARLTYEEYKERAKQKKLEKTRKKMQQLEEKLQKESTE